MKQRYQKEAPQSKFVNCIGIGGNAKYRECGRTWPLPMTKMDVLQYRHDAAPCDWSHEICGPPRLAPYGKELLTIRMELTAFWWL